MSWPPTVDELLVNALDSLIPQLLFNVLALISNQLVYCIRKYVCTLYGSTNDNVNQARYILFCNTAPLKNSLPPKGARIHTKRVNYQACLAFISKYFFALLAFVACLSKGLYKKKNILK